MLTEEASPSLASLHAEITELKLSMEKLQTLILSVKPELDRRLQPKIAFDEAASHVRSEYSHLLNQLSK